jgi:hypothetical protein
MDEIADCDTLIKIEMSVAIPIDEPREALVPRAVTAE